MWPENGKGIAMMRALQRRDVARIELAQGASASGCGRFGKKGSDLHERSRFWPLPEVQAQQGMNTRHPESFH